MKKDENNSKEHINFLLVFRAISLVIVIICFYFIGHWYLENKSNLNLSNTLASKYNDSSAPDSNKDIENIRNTLYEKYKINFANPNFEELCMENESTVAWITIDNTNINFPIVKYTDNDYYLKHDFYNKENSAGWIFADFRNNFDILDKNTIIYGHNRRNGTMFSNLRYFLDEEWFKDKGSKYFSFTTKNKHYVAEIFSIYSVNANNFSLSNTFSSDEQFDLILKTYKNNSIYSFDTDVSSNDNILTLCTCDNNTSKRVVVHAKLTRLY